MDTLGTTFTDSTGGFLIRGLPAGSYKLVFVPNSAYELTVKENVTITLGNVTHVGTVAIQEP